MRSPAVEPRKIVSGVTGTFDDEEVALLLKCCVRRDDFLLQLPAVQLAGEVVAGEVLVERHGVHEGDVLFEPVGLRHEDRVHVEHQVAVALDLRPDRLDEADSLVFLPRQVHERHAHGGLAAVLPGSSNEDLLCHLLPLPV